MPEYAFILLFLALFTFFLHRSFNVQIYPSRRHLLIINLICLLVITVWDNYAIWRGHWTFGPQFLLGPKIGFMPIEEYGFALVIPYFGLVLYKILASQLRVK